MKNLTPAQIDGIKKWKLQEGIRELARRYYADYVEYVHQGRWKKLRHLKPVCEKLQGIVDGKVKRLMIFMPPQHGKSMTVTETFPSFFLGRNPDKRVIILSYGDKLAGHFGISNRDKIQEFGKELFGIELSASKATQNLWEIKGQRGGLLSTMIQGGVTGHGANGLIIDDPIKGAEEAESATYRGKLWDAWVSVAYTRLRQFDDPWIIIILTRWHEMDLAGQILAKESGKWDVVSLPAICESENDIINRKVGEGLWLSGAKYNEIKEHVGSRVFNSLYQQRPAPLEGTLFNRNWWRFYDIKPEKFDQILQSWDLTFKDGVECDHVVGQTWGVHGANRYLIDQFRAKMGFVDTLTAIRRFWEKHGRPSRILIEDKANGSAVIDSLKGTIPGIIPYSPRESKFVRAQAITPLLEAGNVYLPNPSKFSWVEDLIEECANFPNGRNDDQVDSMTQVLNYLRQNKVAKLQFREIKTGTDWDNSLI